MATHRLKILDSFANDVLDGSKSFELRYNDRNYQRGDYVKFVVVDEDGGRQTHPLNDVLFRVVYVLGGWGLKDGYVALGLKKCV